MEGPQHRSTLEKMTLAHHDEDLPMELDHEEVLSRQFQCLELEDSSDDESNGSGWSSATDITSSGLSSLEDTTTTRSSNIKGLYSWDQSSQKVDKVSVSETISDGDFPSYTSSNVAGSYSWNQKVDQVDASLARGRLAPNKGVNYPSTIVKDWQTTNNRPSSQMGYTGGQFETAPAPSHVPLPGFAAPAPSPVPLPGSADFPYYVAMNGMTGRTAPGPSSPSPWSGPPDYYRSDNSSGKGSLGYASQEKQPPGNSVRDLKPSWKADTETKQKTANTEIKKKAVVKEVMIPSSSSSGGRNKKTTLASGKTSNLGKAKKQSGGGKKAGTSVKSKAANQTVKSTRADVFADVFGVRKGRTASALPYSYSYTSAYNWTGSSWKTYYAPKKKPTMNEVCFVLDTSNPAMEKFFTPLRLNLEKYWEVLSSCSDLGLRMSLVTPSKKVEFTSNKEEFLSSSNDLLKSEAVNRNDDMAVISGLEQCMKRLGSFDWTRGSARYIYVLTNLSGWDSDNTALKWRLIWALYSVVTRHLPRGAETLMGRWMTDNEILEQAFIRANRPVKKFPLLSLKDMASYVVGDKALLEGVIAGMNHVTEKPSKVSFHLQPVVPFILSEATISQLKPLNSIQDVLSNAWPNFCSRKCWMTRTKIHREGPEEVISLGKLGLEKGDWKEDVMLRSFKVDEINGRKGPESVYYHKCQANAAAVAKFFATQYNKEHRPENCSRIMFLNGYVIEEACEERKQRVFYAEQLLQTETGVPEFTQYCDDDGFWHESVIDESLLRFTLTCFKLSGGDVMLSGLQGIRRGDDLILKAPTLLSKMNGGADVKEWMKEFRKNTKSLIAREAWKTPVPEPRGYLGFFY